MRVMSLLILCSLLMFFAAVEVRADEAKQSRGGDWSLADMHPKLVEVGLDPERQDCADEQCTFGLHYFTGADFNAGDPKRKNILFIPGGPGQIVHPQERPLSFLEKDHNVVYFHVRGTGLSLVGRSNAYDKYLRAKYVVEDLERLRQALHVKTWHVIYAHSWGTIVAQLYGEKSEKLTRESSVGTPDKPEKIVQALVLSAPVARGKTITESDRNVLIASNLRDIYSRYRSLDENCVTRRRDEQPSDVEAVMQFMTGVIPDSSSDSQDVAGDFCFMSPEIVHEILAELMRVLNALDKYGSFTFVASHYEKLDGDLKFKQLFPYMPEFYRALQILQALGGAEEPAVPVTNSSRRQKAMSALYLGYYLTLPAEAWADKSHSLYPFRDGQRGCQVGAPLLQGLSTRTQQKICARINRAALDEFLGSGAQSSESLRGRTVYGVYDGLNRWLFETAGKNNSLDEHGCLKGSDLRDLAAGRLGADPVVVAEAGRLGFDLSDRICPWRPSKHLHGVRTLILKGKADPVIAGGQAEELFNDGLIGERTLVEFPGVGHSMRLPEITVDGRTIHGGDVVGKLIAGFLRTAPESDGFGAEIMRREIDSELRSMLAKLQVEIQTVNVSSVVVGRVTAEADHKVALR